MARYKKKKKWGAKFTKTKPSVSSFVVAIKYAHIHDLRHAKRVVSVLSPLASKSCWGYDMDFDRAKMGSLSLFAYNKGN